MVREQGFAVTALTIQVCPQLDSFSCSRRVVIRHSTSKHGDQAVKLAACARGLHLPCFPTFSPLGYMTIMLIFMKWRGFRVGEGRQRVMTCEQYTSDRGTCCPKAFSNVKNI